MKLPGVKGAGANYSRENMVHYNYLICFLWLWFCRDLIPTTVPKDCVKSLMNLSQVDESLFNSPMQRATTMGHPWKMDSCQRLYSTPKKGTALIDSSTPNQPVCPSIDFPSFGFSDSSMIRNVSCEMTEHLGGRLSEFPCLVRFFCSRELLLWAIEVLTIYGCLANVTERCLLMGWNFLCTRFCNTDVFLWL